MSELLNGLLEKDAGFEAWVTSWNTAYRAPTEMRYRFGSLPMPRMEVLWVAARKSRGLCLKPGVWVSFALA